VADEIVVSAPLRFARRAATSEIVIAMAADTNHLVYLVTDNHRQYRKVKGYPKEGDKAMTKHTTGGGHGIFSIASNIPSAAAVELC
jgi:hypothetical protein